MILDLLDNWKRYAALNPAFATAFAYLESQSLAELSSGRHDVDGDRVYAIVGRDPGRGREGAKLEVHRRYIDVQFVVSGCDEIGWRPLVRCESAEKPYDDGKDYALFADPPVSWIAVPARHFAVFYPEDAHAPLGGEGILHKVVVKVAVSG